jgi:hypothetical protein
MKIQKPTFDSEKQVYVSEIKEGFRCEAIRDAQRQFTPPLPSFYTSMQDSFVDSVVLQTKGWFRKPLTKEWLEPRVVFHIPTETIADEFEGCCTWEINKLIISKEKFDFFFTLVETKADEQLMISFEEPETNAMTRRKEYKDKVLKLRTKAARALFQAEHATQEYCKTYGEDTDWETTDDEAE